MLHSTLQYKTSLNYYYYNIKTKITYFFKVSSKNRWSWATLCINSFTVFWRNNAFSNSSFGNVEGKSVKGANSRESFEKFVLDLMQAPKNGREIIHTYMRDKLKSRHNK